MVRILNSNKQRYSPRGHILKFLALASKLKYLALASKPTSLRKSLYVLGSKTVLFFDWLKKNNQTKDNINLYSVV